MTTTMSFLLLSSLLVIAAMLVFWKSLMSPEHRVTRFLTEVGETVAQEREGVLKRAREFMTAALAEEELKLAELRRELDFFASFAASSMSRFFAAHRRALASGLFVGDVAAQAYFRSARADTIGWAGVVLIGFGVAVVLAGLGFAIALLTAMAFKNRPAKAWRVLDWGAGLSGAFAVAAALALILTSGVQRESDAEIVLLLGTYMTPLLLWGGVSSGVFAGTAFLQTADTRLTREIRHHENFAATWRVGLEHLQRLAAELGLAVLLLVSGSSASFTSVQVLSVRNLEAQDASSGSGKGPISKLQRGGSPSTLPPSHSRACAFVRDGSASLDPAFASAALDSALLMLSWYARAGRCASVLAVTVTEDTSWAPRKWIALPPSGRRSCETSAAATGNEEGAVWGSLLSGLSPVFERAQSKRSVTRCAEQRRAEERAYEGALARALQEIRGSLKSWGNSEGRSAVREMLTFGSSNRFQAAIILSDAIETADPAGTVPNGGSSDLQLVLTPTKSRYGGARGSLEAAQRLTREFPQLKVTPFVDVGAVLGR